MAVSSKRWCLAALACCLLVQGCSFFRDPLQAQVPLEGMRAIRRDRLVHVTLLGGAALNPGRDNRPRPVQVCVYLVGDSAWLPKSWLDDAQCRGEAGDTRVFDRERRVIANGQTQQLDLKMPSDRDGWLVVDPDFGMVSGAQPPALKLKTDSGEFSAHVVVLDGTRARDAMKAPDGGAPPAGWVPTLRK